MSAFNNNIRIIRGLTDLTQPLFAKLIKSNESNVKTWETTEVQCKSFSVLQTLAVVAGITVDDLKNKQLKNEDIRINVEMVDKIKREAAGELMVNEDPIEYKKVPTYGDPAFLAGQLSIKDEVLAEKEARRKEAVALAEKMEAHYKDMAAALERAQNTISEVLQPMVISLKEIPPVLDAILRNSSEHDREIMTALDHLVGNTPGTLQKEAGKRILKSAVEQQRKGKAQAGK